MASSEKKKIVVCPRCQSPNITSFMGFETGWKYECKDCGYIGALTEEIEIDVEKLER